MWLLIRDLNSFRERVANALGRHTRNFRGREMHDSALVGIQWTELLIDSRVARLLGEVRCHAAQLDVLAFAIRERVHEHASIAGEVPPDDWWLMDNERVVYNLIDEEGKPAGLAITTDPRIVSYCQTVRVRLWQLATPASEYADSAHTWQQ